MSIISVHQAVKEYKVKKKGKGIAGALRSLYKPETVRLKAVDGISFQIEPGEIVGFLGPNGAGKSTTIKMLTGILHPSSGDIRVNGLSPQKNRKEVVQNIGVVFGQRTQLNWDLRLGESFELMKRIYRIEDKAYQENVAMFKEMFKLDELLNTPVRQLSLGQRMRGEIAAALLHSPSILFLDEPTIGLDTDAKYSIREFIKMINKTRKTTVILTTHDLDDVEYLCNRLIVINHGKVIVDGPKDEIIDGINPYRMLVVELQHPTKQYVHPTAQLVHSEGLKHAYRFNPKEINAAELISDLSRLLPIKDIRLQEPDIEDTIRELYRQRASND